ncbi:ABATE domain-containing protein [Kitasatospora sp. NPDC089797]|uniref:CGNR zinc finger domain-containing protein n=1 Tax=Kitasatospora sp. NPDC089797 TaxID=3155298 RepID=UPI00341A44EE
MDAATGPDTPRFRSGAGRLSLDFMRTLRLRGQVDAVEELDTPEALAAWVAQLGPCPVDPAVPLPGEPLLAEARQLREAVHALLDAARAGTSPAAVAAADRARLNRAAARPTPVPVLGADGRLGHTAAAPVEAVLALVARDALDLATSPALDRLRACAGANCAAWFLDTSRPGNRRWCSMGTCGNQAKKASWRTRQQAVDRA